MQVYRHLFCTENWEENMGFYICQKPWKQKIFVDNLNIAERDLRYLGKQNKNNY